ncbi:hypothetical protein GCM10020219_022490 [Nonomuraea dietziae]
MLARPEQAALVDALFSLHDLAAGETTSRCAPLGRPATTSSSTSSPAARGLACAFTYKTTLFSAPTDRQDARHFEALL